MDYIDRCKQYISAKNSSDAMKLNYLNKVDIDVCKYVIDQLLYVDVNLRSKKRILLDELIEKSLEEMVVFGDKVVDDTRKLVETVPINMVNSDILLFVAKIGYGVYDDNILEVGKVCEYFIPKKIYDYSVFIFSHEHLHALKETNYSEWKNANIIGEVIPLFYELVSFDSDDALRKELLKFRLQDLFYNKYEFEIANELVEENMNSDEVGLYEYVRTIVGRYLNSFYYAVILYNMYRQSPNKILDMVSRVLKQEMTTLDVLQQLNIYGDIRGDVFEKELGKIKQLIK